MQSPATHAPAADSPTDQFPAESAVATARLPPISPEDRTLLHNYIALREDPAALATHSGLPYLDIIDFTSRPDIAAWVDHIRALRARNLRDAALAELKDCMRSSRDPIERRRAATTILRATDPARWSRSRKHSVPARITRAAGTALPGYTPDGSPNKPGSEHPHESSSQASLATAPTSKPAAPAGLAESRDEHIASRPDNPAAPAPEPESVTGNPEHPAPASQHSPCFAEADAEELEDDLELDRDLGDFDDEDADRDEDDDDDFDSEDVEDGDDDDEDG